MIRVSDSKKRIEALTYWNADRFKALQRKLTSARNTIQKEALSRDLEPFFTEDEVETLNKAAGILASVKRKIEHAKEVKAREEKQRDARLDNYKVMRTKLLDIHLPK